MGHLSAVGTRTDRERRAYDEEDIGPTNGWWHDLFRHVFECPNTIRHVAQFSELLAAKTKGKRVLEIGCGSGELSERLHKEGARHVFGVDLSVEQVTAAKSREVEGRLEFALKDLNEPIEGAYDLVFGRSILHHLDYRPILSRLYRENLTANGTMVFVEPLGSNVLIKLYHFISRSGHTSDEKPLLRSDLAWLKAQFPSVQVLPANFFSFMIGVPSSFVSSRADNPVLRLADRADSWLAARAPQLTPYFRTATITIRKNGEW
jgi:2-polyprenyl-3-methyl-5-hydroxy-6-metoxy-1,4-benzoquinol methylase